MNPRGTPANLKRGPGPGRPPGSANRLTQAALALGKRLADTAPQTNKAFAQHLLTDREYLALALARIAAGKADHLEKFIWEHGLGRPPVSEEDGRDRPLVQVILGDPRSLPDPLGEDPPDVELFPPSPVKVLTARRVEEPAEECKAPPAGGIDEDEYRY